MGDALQQAPRRLSGLIALILGVATQAWAASVAAAPTDPVEARLEIDTSEAGGGAEVLHRRIEERANIVLRQAKVLPGDTDDVAIEVVVRELAGDEPGYAVTFELHAADGSQLAEPLEVNCRLCTETELVARVETELEPVIQVMIQALHEREAASDEAPPAAPPPEPAPEPLARDAAPREHKGMLAGGVTLLVVGSGALGAGVGLAIPEPKIDRANPLDLITTRPVGYALLASGIVAATAGAVLTALAIEHRRKPRWSMAPFGGRHHAGIAIGWSSK